MVPSGDYKQNSCTFNGVILTQRLKENMHLPLEWFLYGVYSCSVLGMPSLKDNIVSKSQVEIGSRVTLIGLSVDKEENPKNKFWLKDDRLLSSEQTPKYTFLNSGTILIINDFMRVDAGQYAFIYWNNSTSKRRIFKLTLTPKSGKLASSYHPYHHMKR